jgi:hypothetical protein
LSHAVDGNFVTPGRPLPGGSHDDHIATEVNARPIAYAKLRPELIPGIGISDYQPARLRDPGSCPLTDAPNIQGAGVSIGSVAL